MKKTILVSALLFFASFAHAQDGYYDFNKKTKVSFGLEAGANVSNLTHREFNMDNGSTPKVPYHFKEGVRAGAVINVNFSQRIDLRSGIYYSVKGADKVLFTNSFFENLYYGKLALNYLELPVNIFVHIGQKRNLYLGGGGYIAYAVGGHFKLENSNTVTKLNFSGDNKSNYTPSSFERLDYGLQAAVGYKIVSNLFIQVQASSGLANAGWDKNYVKPFTYKNWGFSFTAGWMLGK